MKVGEGGGDFRTDGKRDATGVGDAPRKFRKGRGRMGGSIVIRLPDGTSWIVDREGDEERLFGDPAPPPDGGVDDSLLEKNLDVVARLAKYC